MKIAQFIVFFLAHFPLFSRASDPTEQYLKWWKRTAYEVRGKERDAKREGTYFQRPDILKLDPEPLSKEALMSISEHWPVMRAGHIETIAFLLGMYPGNDIYFLARDAETLYDVARVLTRKEDEVAKRLRLLNVSKNTRNAHYIEGLLAQNGLSPQRGGRPFVLVDSGFEGRIPESILGRMGRARKYAKVHMLHSENSKYPSLTLFSGEYPKSLSGEFEDIPHYTQTAYDIVKVGKKFYAQGGIALEDIQGYPEAEQDIVKAGKKHYLPENVGYFDEEALSMMKDLYHFSLQPENIKHFKRRRAMWKQVYKLTQAEDLEGLALFLKKVLSKEKSAVLRKKIISDLQDYLLKNSSTQVRMEVDHEGNSLTVQFSKFTFCRIYLEGHR